MNKSILRSSRQKGRLWKQDNYNRIKISLVIRPFTVKVNCQIRGLASIRKGLGTENTPFLVSSYRRIASGDVSRRVSEEIFKSPGKAIFANPLGYCFCQSGRVPVLPIRRGPVFANPEGSCFCQSGRVHFSQSVGVLFLPIRRGPVFAKTEGSQICQSGGVLFFQSGGVLFLPIRRGPVFANPEGSCFCQSGGVLFCQNLRGQKKVNSQRYYVIRRQARNQ